MQKATIFSIVIPCFNEEKAIPHFLIELTFFKEHLKIQFPDVILKVVFVNNNSTDQSEQRLTAYSIEHQDTSVVNCSKQGYGAALKLGFSSVSADLYAFLDLDNTYPLDTFFAALKKMQSNSKIDMLMTNRFSKHSGMPWIRNLGNHFFAGLVQKLFSQKISDACSGQRILHSRRIREVIELSCNGLDFSIQLTCHALKQNWTIEYQTMLYKQRDGESKLSVVKDGFLFLKAVLKTKFFE